MPLPDFILAGAPKSGTTSLYRYIRQHPDVYMPEPKEISFFGYNYDRGVEWYRKQFEGHTSERVVGEATPWYMCDRKVVPKQVNEVIPSVSLIFILRNPIDRSRSNYWDDLRNGKFSFEVSFSDVIRNEKIRHTVTKCSKYYENISRFGEYFERDQFLFLLHKDLREKPKKTVQRIYEFLQVDSTFVPDTERKGRVTPGLKYLKHLRNLNRLFLPVEKTFGGTPLTWLWETVPHFRRLFWEEGARPPSPSAQDRAYLRQLYAESNKKLSEYLDRDLSHWDGVESD